MHNQRLLQNVCLLEALDGGRFNPTLLVDVPADMEDGTPTGVFRPMVVTEDADAEVEGAGRFSLMLPDLEGAARAPFDVPLGVTLNLRSFSFSTTRSSRASSSVPSPQARAFFGFFISFGPLIIVGGRIRDGDATRAIGTGDLLDCLDGGEVGGWGCEGKTLETGTRDLARELSVGIVRRDVLGESMGVVGRGTGRKRAVSDGRSGP